MLTFERIAQCFHVIQEIAFKKMLYFSFKVLFLKVLDFKSQFHDVMTPPKLGKASCSACIVPRYNEKN